MVRVNRGCGAVELRRWTRLFNAAGVFVPFLAVEIEPEGEAAIASRSRGTPRVANRLLRRVRDFAEVRGTGVVTGEIATEALSLLDVDEAGLDRHDRVILETIAAKFSGGPVGLTTLADAIDEETDTLEGVYEPYLIQQGLIKRTPRGPGVCA